MHGEKLDIKLEKCHFMVKKGIVLRAWSCKPRNWGW